MTARTLIRHTNDTRIQVEVAPADPGQFTDSESGVSQCQNHMGQPHQLRIVEAVFDHGGHLGRAKAIRVRPLRPAQGIFERAVGGQMPVADQPAVDRLEKGQLEVEGTIRVGFGQPVPVLLDFLLVELFPVVDAEP